MMDADERRAAFFASLVECYEGPLRNHTIAPTPEPEPTPRPQALTDAETLRWQNFVRAEIAAALKEYHASEEVRPITRALVEFVAEDIFNKLTIEAAKINKLRREFDQRGPGDDRSAVIDLPNPFLRNARRA